MPLRGRGRYPQAQARAHEEHDGAIRKYVALKRPGSDAAIALLRDVGAAVKHLMLRHGWRTSRADTDLPVLAEMYPRSANLLGLNVNRGAKICLRLRRAGHPDAFLERNEVIGTYVTRLSSMLHELAHNVRGPHDTQFYSTLAKLTEEYDTAQRLGYWPGAGFLTPGVRLGGRDAPLSPEARRQRAAEQALRRAQGSRLGAGGMRLGGAPRGDRSLRELAAEVRSWLTQAALRRIRDAQTCASASAEEAESIRAETEAAERDAIVVVDSDEEDDAPRAARASGTRHDPIVL